MQSRCIKIFLTDMDGTLTDGARYLSDSGPEIKKFNIPDGLGLILLKKMGVQTGIITTDVGELVKKRAQQLKLDHLITGSHNKFLSAQEICKKTGVSLDEVAFIGDDINDWNLLTAVGYRGCPRNAQPIIKKIDKIRVMSRSGGEGAVREFIDDLFGEEALLKAWEQGI